MRKKTSLVIALFLSQFAMAQKDITVRLINKLNIERTNELVVLSRNFLQQKAGMIPTAFYLECIINSEKQVVQYDDLDGDGVWDEAVMLVSFKPLEQMKVQVGFIKEKPSKPAIVLAHVRHRKKLAGGGFGDIITKDTMPHANPPTNFSKVPLPPYLTEGPAWENDKVAFRLYFDTRNGKDVFGKLVPGMVMDTVGANQNNSYHERANWGMDVLHVGQSLGAGSVALATSDKNGKDTLVRLGGKNVETETYEVIADGPLRAVFRTSFKWSINGKPVEIIDETSIWGGQFFYATSVQVKGAPKRTKLVAGFADFYNNTEGRIETGKIKMLYSYGAQSENKDNLGLAVSVPAKYFKGFEKLADKGGDIKDSYLVYQLIKNQPLTYRFYAGWQESDKRFINKDGFQKYLENQAALQASPIVIK